MLNKHIFEFSKEFVSLFELYCTYLQKWFILHLFLLFGVNKLTEILFLKVL